MGARNEIQIRDPENHGILKRFGSLILSRFRRRSDRCLSNANWTFISRDAALRPDGQGHRRRGSRVGDGPDHDGRGDGAGTRPEDRRAGGTAALPPKAKRVIFLHQSGGPSQLETFDYKPALAKYQGTQIPDSVRQGQRVAQTMGQSRCRSRRRSSRSRSTASRARGSASCCRTPRRSSTTSPSSRR